MAELIREPLFYIFFVYGLSFLSMAYFMFIATGIRKASRIELVSTFRLLAAFGFFHGMTELAEWIRFIFRSADIAEVKALIYMSQGFLLISFVALLQFSINLLTFNAKSRQILRYLPSAFLILYLAFLSITGGVESAMALGRIGVRMLGFTSSALSGIVLVRFSRGLRPSGNMKLANGFLLAGLGFVIFSAFAGQEHGIFLGLPVQFYRAMCAFVIAISSFYVVDVFRIKEPAGIGMENS
ncbi:MAG: hypothetical protein M0Z61_17280 [Nitrospiraceae bacterium]|nr:hypothetical protein [Nitrospiraceae bacterium]